MRIVEDFLDNIDVNLNKEVNHQIEERFRFAVYIGSTIDPGSPSPDTRELYKMLQQRIRKFISVLNAIKADFYWDGITYINYKEYLKNLKDADDLFTPIERIEATRISFYDSDACAGFKIMLNPFDNVRSLVEFLYAYGNLFNDIPGQYRVGMIYYAHRNMIAFSYTGALRLDKSKKENIYELKYTKTLAESVIHCGLIDNITNEDALAKQIADYIVKRPNLKMKVIQ